MVSRRPSQVGSAIRLQQVHHCRSNPDVASLNRSKPSNGLPRTQIWGTLLTDAQLLNDVFVTLGIVGLQVVEQTPPLADHHQKTTPGRVVVLVRFEVLRQVGDPLAQDCDLHLGTAGVARVRGESADDVLFALSR